MLRDDDDDGSDDDDDDGSDDDDDDEETLIDLRLVSLARPGSIRHVGSPRGEILAPSENSH